MNLGTSTCFYKVILKCGFRRVIHLDANKIDTHQKDKWALKRLQYVWLPIMIKFYGFNYKTTIGEHGHHTQQEWHFSVTYVFKQGERLRNIGSILGAVVL